MVEGAVKRGLSLVVEGRGRALANLRQTQTGRSKVLGCGREQAALVRLDGESESERADTRKRWSTARDKRETRSASGRRSFAAMNAAMNEPGAAQPRRVAGALGRSGTAAAC